MKAFVTACIALVGITIGANFILNEIGFSASETTSSPAVRLSDN